MGESYVFGYGRQNQTPDCENGRRSGTVFAVCGFENFRVARSARIESAVLAERHATPDSRQARVFHGGHVLRKTDRRFDKKRRFKPFFTENGVFSAENLYAAGDALLLKPSEPYPIGQKIPLNTRAETSGGVAVRLSKQVTRSALRFFLREGKLIEFTTSLPLFDRKQQ